MSQKIKHQSSLEPETIFNAIKANDKESTISLTQKFLLENSVKATVLAEKNMLESRTPQNVNAFIRSLKITKQLAFDFQLTEWEKHLVKDVFVSYTQDLQNLFTSIEAIYKSTSEDLKEQIDSKYHDKLQICLDRALENVISSLKREIKEYVNFLSKTLHQFLDEKRSKNKASKKRKVSNRKS